MSSFFHWLYGLITDYGHVFIIIIAVVLVMLIIAFMIKHMPSKGRITDLYGPDGKKKNGGKQKDKKI